MESREELVMLLHFDDDAAKSERTFLGFCICIKVIQTICLCCVVCEPVNVSLSQQLMESSSVFGGGSQSGHLVHDLSRRNPAVWHKSTNTNSTSLVPVSRHSCWTTNKEHNEVWILAEGYLAPERLGGSSWCWSSLPAWCRPRSCVGTLRWGKWHQTASGSGTPWSPECIELVSWAPFTPHNTHSFTCIVIHS